LGKERRTNTWQFFILDKEMDGLFPAYWWLTRPNNAPCPCCNHSCAVTLQAKIVGGAAVASIKSYPFIASLQWVGTGAHFCGGSVVSSRFILTAAHCMVGKEPSFVQVVIGRLALASGDGVVLRYVKGAVWGRGPGGLFWAGKARQSRETGRCIGCSTLVR
jgi:hypothetical protein